jgi:hypothetical protein
VALPRQGRRRPDRARRRRARHPARDAHPGPKTGKKCKGKLGKTFTEKRAHGAVRIRTFEKKKFPAGARIEVTVTNPRYVTQIKIVLIKKKTDPGVITRCIEPGSTRRTTC